MTNQQKIRCLFGHHVWGILRIMYDAELPKYKRGDVVEDCTICDEKRFVRVHDYYK